MRLSRIANRCNSYLLFLVSVFIEKKWRFHISHWVIFLKKKKKKELTYPYIKNKDGAS